MRWIAGQIQRILLTLAMANPVNFASRGPVLSHEQKMHRQRQKPEPDQKHLGEIQRLGARGFIRFIFRPGQVDAVFQKNEDARTDPHEDE